MTDIKPHLNANALPGLLGQVSISDCVPMLEAMLALHDEYREMLVQVIEAVKREETPRPSDDQTLA